jgi:hypothetical protein
MNTVGLFWRLWFFPYGRINQVPLREVYDAVRYVLFRWGFIACFRVDNGAPFGEPTRQAFSPLHLLLCALGIRVKLNPPRTPTKNAKVERNQGTTARWADVRQCANHLDLQQKLNQAVLAQRELYPSRTCQDKTRIEAFPSLGNNPNRFHVQGFDLQRVFSLLARGRWQRTISSQGTCFMFGQKYQVGYAHRHVAATVCFDPTYACWVFMNKRGDMLNSLPAVNINEKQILSLSLCQ